MARMEARKRDQRERPREGTGRKNHTSWFALYLPDNKKHCVLANPSWSNMEAGLAEK